MPSPVVFRRHSHEDPETPLSEVPDSQRSREASPPRKPLSPARFVNIRDVGPLSSPPLSSPKTSPQTAASLDAYIQDSEPVPFSSTPDLGSRTASSSPNAEYDSQALVTPPEERFIRTLDRKLQAIVDARNRRGFSSPPGCLNRSRALDDSEDCQAIFSYESVGYQDSTPSSFYSASSKRKRLEPPTCDTTLESGEATTYEDADVDDCEDDEDLTNLPVAKKLKDTSFTYSATEAASARRARSLSVSSVFESQESLIPTEKDDSPPAPSTPVYKLPAVPIIAPPTFEDIPRSPFSPDDIAEARLKALLKRERTFRRREGFENGINNIFDKATTKEQIEELLGIDEEFRQEVIKWMLRVTPSKKSGVNELRHQLRTCPETRFHAILLFTRYFMRVGDAMPIATKRETPLMKLGRKRITWDVAMSCLALSVKFHRDFLGPFSPVYARDFLVLAPHPMSHDDFEISQKDVLEALDYGICDITPGPFMQEIWNSLPSLRKLLSFSDAREIMQLNAWQILNAAALTSEMIQFPMSLLTAAAVIEGAVVALMDIYDQDMEEPKTNKKSREKAEEDIADTVLDVKELMDISSTDMKHCRRWLQKIIRAAY